MRQHHALYPLSLYDKRQGRLKHAEGISPHQNRYLCLIRSAALILGSYRRHAQVRELDNQAPLQVCHIAHCYVRHESTLPQHNCSQGFPL